MAKDYTFGPRYIIVTAYGGLCDLQVMNEVNAYYKQGYRPQGGVAQWVSESGERWTSQAMVKEPAMKVNP